MNRFLPAALLVLAAGAATAVESPTARFALAAPAPAELALPAIDAAAKRAGVLAAIKDGMPTPYADAHDVALAVADSGKLATPALGDWQRLADGRWLWRLEIHAPGAVAIDLGFSRYRLPHGAELWLSGAGKHNRVGPFTDAHNKPHGQFWTPRVTGERALLELVVPDNKREFLALELGTVHQAFLDPSRAALDLAKSGSCNVDVVCPEGDAWRDQIRSVAAYSFNTSGSGLFCTGQFINSTGATGDPLFLTANHCGLTPANAGTVVAYFNFENSSCRTPGSAASGGAGDGPTNVFVSGATLLAQTDPNASGIAGSDFALLRFDDATPEAANAYFTGWDRSSTVPANATAIHHPSGDEKRISFENDPLSITSYLVDTAGGTTHFRIEDWDVGTTEPGSSGSGLWNSSRRLVGVLSGGFAACGNDDPDWYGRLAHAWDTNAADNRRLEPWLDPAGDGVQVLNGTASCEAPSVTLSSTAFNTPPGAGQTVSFSATASGGAGGYSYAWDLDGNGTFEIGDRASVSATYPKRDSLQVSVRVADATGCARTVSRALDIVGPRLAVTAGAPSQICGDGDSVIEPGERFRLPLNFSNTGSATFASGGHALLREQLQGADALPFGPDAYGYRASEACSYQFIDIASGSNAVAALPTSVFNGNTFGPLDDARTTTPIQLGGSAPAVFGQARSIAVMSTNGYMSFSDSESGGDFSSECTNPGGNGSVLPRLHVLHDDLVVGGGANAGLRHRRFASCPRPGDAGGSGACHVFQWTGMETFSGGGGAAEFQAVVYEGSGQIVYQYRSVGPLGGGDAVSGLASSATASDPLNVRSCGVGNLPSNGTAVCIYDPAAQPAAGDSGLTLAPGAVPLPSIGVGAQGAGEIELHIDADADCGAPIELGFLGAANASQSAPADGDTVFSTTLGNGGSCQVSSCPAPARDDARYGLYFQGQRPGNGLLHFVYEAGAVDAYGGVWYTARGDRLPTWYTLQGTQRGDLAATELRAFTNSAAPGGFNPVSEVVGRAWVAQAAEETVLMAWAFDGGGHGIEQLGTIGLPFSDPNRTQLWFNGGQSGWGIGIESNAIPGGGYSEFMATFLFDAAGNARWVVGGDDATSGSLDAITYRVHCPGCPFVTDQLSLPLPAGGMSRSYSGTTSGTLDTAITLPAPLSGSWNRNQLPIQPIAEPEQP